MQTERTCSAGNHRPLPTNWENFIQFKYRIPLTNIRLSWFYGNSSKRRHRRQFSLCYQKTKSSFHIDLIYKACHIMRPQTWKRISITNVPSYHLSQVTYSINKTEVRRFFFRLPFSPCGKKSQNPELNFLVDSFVNISFKLSSILPSVVCFIFEQRA